MMVTCWKCIEALPQNCTCDDSPREKRLRLLELILRESLLIQKIVQEDFVPRVTLGKTEITPNITIEHTENGIAAVLSLEFKSDDWRKHRILTLYDVEGTPLYRRKLSKLYIGIRKDDQLTIEHWKLAAICVGELI